MVVCIVMLDVVAQKFLVKCMFHDIMKYLSNILFNGLHLHLSASVTKLQYLLYCVTY